MTPLFLSALFFFSWSLYWIYPIGYLSDDWDLMARALSSPFWLPIEKHHYSPFINALFTLANKTGNGPLIFHFLAAFLHALNVFFTGYFARYSFSFSRESAFLASVFFGFTPAGFEAISWCCAIGYPATVLLIFLGWLCLEKTASKQLLSWQLAALQLLSYLVWDWGILFSPMMFIWALLKNGHLLLGSLKITFLPITVSICCFLFKTLYGLSAGYGRNDFFEMARHLIAMPLLTLAPNFSVSDYSSIYGAIAALFILIALLWMAVKDSSARLFFSLYLISIGPVLLFAYPQSRYAYFSSLFLTWMIFWMLEKRKLLLTFFCFSTFFMGYERADQWQKAGLASEELLTEIKNASKDKKIVIAKLPDRYGNKEMIWMPYLCRSGFSSLGQGARSGKLEEANYQISLNFKDNRWQYSLQVVHTPDLQTK